MSYNADRAHDISDDGLILENGVHIISGSESPQGIVNPVRYTIYFRTNGDIWVHIGSGGINAWTLSNLESLPSLSQVPVYAGNGTLTNVTFYSSDTQIAANRVGVITLAYDGNLNPTIETTTIYSTSDGTTVLKTITKTFTFVANVLTNVTQVTT